ncbi:MAG TPA: dihydrodipicolinate synthase family protein [Bauldia sp.]|nr:dihydrodipicolinate synthase family protein [Bauldia sp.]
MAATRFQGVLVPVVTPFRGDHSIDVDRWYRLCRSLLAQGANGLAIFGTTSEANSIGSRQRMAALESLVERGIPADRLMPGIGACSMDEVTELLRHATSLGCGGVLMLPPFYYKGVTDEGLLRFVTGVVSRAGNPTNVYLYHIPPVAQVGFSLDLIERLTRELPGIVVGLKDSSGDLDNTLAIIRRLPGFDVFCGSEVFLLDTLRAGGVGCITATGSVNAHGIHALYQAWRTDRGIQLQERATAVRKAVQQFPLIPAVKAILAQANDDADWKTVLPPLVSLSPAAEAQLHASLDALGFASNSLLEAETSSAAD